MTEPLTCFKAYDVRGKLGEDLDDDIAYRIGRAFAETMRAQSIVIGQDCRESSASLADAVAQGMMDNGAEVLDLGLCGTEEVYFATSHLGADGGLCVTASHNPMNYNGMKMVKTGSAPIGRETGLDAIKALAETADFAPSTRQGKRTNVSDTRRAFVDCVLSFVHAPSLKPLKILVNAGNGAAGPTFDAIADALETAGVPLQFTRLHHHPDGSFPNGIPNPLLPENQPATADAVRAADADFGVAWDGDFDRCFFFDHMGQFIAGEYVVGLLADAFLTKQAGETIVHDPRIIWNTQDVVARAGGHAVQARTGHAHLKQALRDTGAVYGGEMSAHHYFRDFMSCDSGMIPWLLIAELVSRKGESLHDLVASARSAFPSSGEINFRVTDVASTMARVEETLAPSALHRDDMDGIGLDFGDWRCNVRSSNTEPLLRLNVEARGDASLVERKVGEISALISQS